MTEFNLKIVEGKTLSYIDINVTELGRQAVKEHKDIHKLVASKMFNVKYEDVTDEQRRIAKTLNFKCMYAAGLI